MLKKFIVNGIKENKCMNVKDVLPIIYALRNHIDAYKEEIERLEAENDELRQRNSELRVIGVIR